MLAIIRSSRKRLQATCRKFLAPYPDNTLPLNSQADSRNYHAVLAARKKAVFMRRMYSSALLTPTTKVPINVITARKRATMAIPSERGESKSYFDYVNAEYLKDEIKDKILKVLFPSKTESNVEYFLKRKAEERVAPVRSVRLPKRPNPVLAAKPQTPPIKYAPERKNYSVFMAPKKDSILPQRLNINGIEVINGKIVMEKLKQQEEKKEEATKKEVEESVKKKKMSSREYIYMLTRGHRLSKEEKSAPKREKAVTPAKEAQPKPAQKKAVKTKNKSEVPPRRSYHAFLMKRSAKYTKNYKLHGIEIFKDSSSLFEDGQEPPSDQMTEKVITFDNSEETISIKAPMPTPAHRSRQDSRSGSPYV